MGTREPAADRGAPHQAAGRERAETHEAAGTARRAARARAVRVQREVGGGVRGARASFGVRDRAARSRDGDKLKAQSEERHLRRGRGRRCRSRAAATPRRRARRAERKGGSPQLRARGAGGRARRGGRVLVHGQPPLAKSETRRARPSAPRAAAAEERSAALAAELAGERAKAGKLRRQARPRTRRGCTRDRPAWDAMSYYGRPEAATRSGIRDGEGSESGADQRRYNPAGTPGRRRPR